MNPIAIAIILALSIATWVAFTHEHTRRISEREEALSRQDVIREFRRIRLHRPEDIAYTRDGFNYRPEYMWRWDQER